MITDGDLVALPRGEQRCCPEGALSTDTILVSTLREPAGTQKRGLFGQSPKGVSLRGAVVYVVRINKQGEMKMARPCDTCWEKLRKLKVKAVIYTADDGGFEIERIT